jgi:hypothetical protein
VPNDSITYSLSGEVSLSVFASAVKDIQALIEALAAEIVGGKDRPEWIVEYLEAGSATMTFAGQAEGDQADEMIEKIVRGYAAVGRSLEAGSPMPYSRKVEGAARRLTGVLNGTVTSVRFETHEETATVVSPSATVQAQKLLYSYGAIEGRIQTLTSRGGLQFVLYDSVFGKAVRCYLEPGGEEQMRGAWDRRAVVEGWVSREPVTGRPLSVRRVSNVVMLDEIERGSYRKARAAVPLGVNEPLPEESVRILRDAS